jgi:plasmid stabilization system protein ParE
MAFDLYIRPEAEWDIQEACEWYAAQREGLDQQFFHAVTAKIEWVRQHPFVHAVVQDGARLARLKRFQYVIAYLVHDDEVEIVAVFHGHRDPEFWQSRL